MSSFPPTPAPRPGGQSYNNPTPIGTLKGGDEPPYYVQPIGQLQSNTIRSLIVGIVAVGATFGARWVITDENLARITEGVSTLVSLISILLAWYFRVTADRKIVTGAKATDIARALSWVSTGAGIVLTLGCAGCGTINPQQSVAVQLFTTERAYTEIAGGIADAVRAGLITNKDQLRTIRDVDDEINATFDDAEAKLARGDRVGAGFAAGHLAGLLDRLYPLQRSSIPVTKARPAARPTTRSTRLPLQERPWTRSSSSSVSASSNWPTSTPPTRPRKTIPTPS